MNFDKYGRVHIENQADIGLANTLLADYPEAAAKIPHSFEDIDGPLNLSVSRALGTVLAERFGDGAKAVNLIDAIARAEVAQAELVADPL